MLAALCGVDATQCRNARLDSSWGPSSSAPPRAGAVTGILRVVEDLQPTFPVDTAAETARPAETTRGGRT